MLSFLVLCTLLRTLQGASVPPPLNITGSAATGNVLAVAPECPASPVNGGQQHRTVYTIVRSCILTISACVWKSIHPNINGPRDSGWTRLKRRLIIMLCALIAPEFVLYWAVNQRVSAQANADKYNEEVLRLRRAEKPSTTLWGKIVGWFQPLPKDTTRRGGGQPWTITHGFFIDMGGFLLYENEYPIEVLDLARLSKLIRKKAVDAPTVMEIDIQDRSKGDTISKTIVIIQILWFVVQCIARAAQRLPLSELEVVTLAFAVVNGAIYWAWWDKPQGVGATISVQLKIKNNDSARTLVNAEARSHQYHPYPMNLPQPESHSADDNVPLIPLHGQQPDESTGQHSWLRRMLRKDRDQHRSSFVWLCCLPWRTMLSVLRPFNKMENSQPFDRKQLRVPMFHTNDSDTPWETVLMSGTIFGVIHFFAWSSEFPSLHDRELWRISTVITVVVLPLAHIGGFLLILGAKTLGSLFLFVFFCGIPLYIVARVILIFIAFKAIIHPPCNVLLDIAWTKYIPHV